MVFIILGRENYYDDYELSNSAAESPNPETIYNDIIDSLDLYSAYIESADITELRFIVSIRVLSVNFTDFVEEIKTSGDLLAYSKIVSLLDNMNKILGETVKQYLKLEN